MKVDVNLLSNCNEMMPGHNILYNTAYVSQYLEWAISFIVSCIFSLDVN